MKFCVQEVNIKGKTALSKAVADVRDICIKNGYVSIGVIRKLPFWGLLKLWWKLKKNDTVVLQWPFYGAFGVNIGFCFDLKMLVKILSIKDINLIVLLHDLNSLRNYTTFNNIENSVLMLAKKIIVHTEAMKQYIENKGFASKSIKILTSFDYLTTDNLKQRNYSNTVVYAGNLKKSPFLLHIPSNSFGVTFNCYGLLKEKLPSHLCYKGTFVSENVSVLEGSWGLVWDGDSVETCSGWVGEYLKVNSPHKVSLYIVSGLPIIIWKEAGLASYIVDNNLGITIGSLSEINNAIKSISEEKYQKMIAAIAIERQKLITGKHLLQSLEGVDFC